MKHKVTISTLLLVALFLTLAPIAAGTTWYVDGVKGNDSNKCNSPTTPACKTIGHAIALAASILTPLSKARPGTTLRRSRSPLHAGALPIRS
jgi:hypothetical protein